MLNLMGSSFKGVLVSKDNYFSYAGLSFEFDSDFDKSFIEEIIPEYIIPSEGQSESGKKPKPLEQSNIIEVDE